MRFHFVTAFWALCLFARHISAQTIEAAYADPYDAFLGWPRSSGYNLTDNLNRNCSGNLKYSSSFAGLTKNQSTCLPVGTPGTKLTISYNTTYLDHVVWFGSWNSKLSFEYICWDIMSGGRRILDFPNIQTFYRGVTPAILKDEIILPGVDDLNNSKASCSDVNPFAKLSIVIESLDNDKAALSLSIPFTLDISQRRRVENGTLNIELEKFGKDSIAALGIAGLAVVFLVIWSTILWVSHKKRSVLYKGAKGQSDDSKKAIRKNATDVLEDTDADGATRVLLMSEDPTRSLVIPVAALGKLGEVSEGVKKHIDSFGVEKLCQGSDEFEIGQKISSTPSATRVQTLGKVGMSLYQLLPFRLATIGNATLVVGENGNLIKLPRLFNYIVSALWLPVLLLVIIFGIGVVVTDYIFIQTIDSNFGYFWLAGGVGLSGTLIYMQSTYKAPIKGMLRLFRSIAPPTCEEFMFSYCWRPGSRPDDIRTLARAMYEIGLHVWIDTVKLISGSMISSSLISAVRTANTVIIFLSPDYLIRENTCTELIEALHYPAKIHLHIVKWDRAVYDAVKVLVTQFDVPHQRLTAHKYDGKEPLDLDENETEINKAALSGKGWYDLTAMLNAYSKDDNDTLDFQWWIKHSSNLGGVPLTAPYPKGVASWNFWGLIPGGFEKTTSKDIRLGGVWLRSDARRTGTRASAFPWFLIPMIVFTLFPLADVGIVALREHEVYLNAVTCANSLRETVIANKPLKDDRNVSFPTTYALQGICRRFHHSEAFQTKYSAFKMDLIKWKFDTLYNEFSKNCTAHNETYWLYPRLSGYADISDDPCVYELQYYFAWRDYYAPRNVHIVFFLIFFLLYLFLVILNGHHALNYRDPPACLRPLLATSNLVRDLAETADGENSNKAQHGSKKEIVIPPIRVAVHGTGEVTTNLREFLKLIKFAVKDGIFDEEGRVIPPSQTAIEMEAGIAVRRSLLLVPPRQHSFVPKDFIWVDVFVLSTVKDRQKLYERRNTLRYDRMVVVIGTDGVLPKNENDDDPSKKWLFSIMFIDCQQTGDDFARLILENVSLRTKDVLVSYGQEVFSKEPM